ncbi:MAG TPA: sulfur carrier protein ThiS [Streptosporangiaceae bacterium]|jgi:sulfur carrier protein|nr:sulfur carrier protein ThiS [Streptosporangiaceae bacterium]
MEIVINGHPHEVPDATSLDRAVALISTSATGIAVAVNGDVVSRVTWPQVRLANGDQVEVLTAVQGG